MSRIVLGVSGGVAAYKAIEVCRRLCDAGHFVSPILTESSLRFVGAATFAAVASEPPRTSLWDSPEPSPHTTLGRGTDLVAVVPATANLIGSYANGLAHDLLTTTLLATAAPVVLAPAMHTEMWEHPAVQANLATLRDRGVRIIDPEVGHLAGGDFGAGRLASIDTIVESVTAALARSQDLAGVRVIITAGGTREAIDPVRFLGNRSSGKQGHALAQAAADRGAHVTLITTNPATAPQGLWTLPVNERESPQTLGAGGVVAVESAVEMHDAVLQRLGDHDVMIMAAAVADFRPETAAEQKLKKHDGPPEIRLVPTVDILEAVARLRRSDQTIVGFAAETRDAVASGREKLTRKQLDAIVVNDVSQAGVGFEHDTNAVTVIDRDGGEWSTAVENKRTVADHVLNTVVHLRSGRR